MYRNYQFGIGLLLCLLCVGLAESTRVAVAREEPHNYFENSIRPILPMCGLTRQQVYQKLGEPTKTERTSWTYELIGTNNGLNIIFDSYDPHSRVTSVGYSWYLQTRLLRHDMGRRKIAGLKPYKVDMPEAYYIVSQKTGECRTLKMIMVAQSGPLLDFGRQLRDSSLEWVKLRIKYDLWCPQKITTVKFDPTTMDRREVFTKENAKTFLDRAYVVNYQEEMIFQGQLDSD